MSTQNTRGIIIRRDRFQNTSYLITWITNGYGVIKTMARGAAKAGHPWGAQLDLFHECDLMYRPSRGGEIQNLAEVQLISSHEGLRYQYERLLTAHYVVGLVESAVEKNSPIPELYDLVIKAVEYLSQKGSSLKFVERYERRLLMLAGHDDGKSELTTLELFYRAGIKVPKTRPEMLRYLS